MAATSDHPREDGPAARTARAAQRDTVRTPVPAGRTDRSGGVALDSSAVARVPAQRTGSGQPRGRAPLPVAAAVVTLWAALLSALPVTEIVALAQLADAPSVSTMSVLRYGLAGWLLGHGVPLHTGLGTVGLTPLAVSALAAWRVARAGVHVTRAIRAHHTGSARHAFRVALAVGVAYSGLGVAAAALCRGPGLTVSLWRAGATFGVFAAVAALTGAMFTTGAVDRLVLRAPAPLRDGVRTALVATLLVLGAGAALAGTALAVAGAQASQTLATYRTGVAGQAGLTLVCLAYAPNVAVWAASYLLGPGFAVGVDTAVRTSEVTVGAMPAVPVFAAMPGGPVSGGWVVLLGAPLAAGMVAGALLARRHLRRA